MKKYIIFSFVTLLTFIVFGTMATVVKSTRQKDEIKVNRAIELIDKIGADVFLGKRANEDDLKELRSLKAYIPVTEKYKTLKSSLDAYEEGLNKEAKTDDEKKAKEKYAKKDLKIENA